MTSPPPPNPLPSTPDEAVRWWERRRLAFNTLLFVIGTISFLGTLAMMDLMPRDPNEDPGDFLGMCCAVPLYAILANVCYTAGPSLERRRPLPDPTAAHRRRQTLYRRGLLFSCLLTALPFLLTSLACLVAWLRRK